MSVAIRARTKATVGTVRLAAQAAAAASRSGALGLGDLRHVPQIVAVRHRSGASLGTLGAIMGIRRPDAIAIVDERGSVSFGDLDRRAAAIAGALHQRYGIGPGRSVGVMCRNHGGFVEAAFAVTRCGADLLFLNTEFGDRQLGEVLARERPDVVIADEEFLPALAAAAPELDPIVAWHDGSAWHGADVTLDTLRKARAVDVPRVKPGRLTLLTAGTTGTPKGAPRRVSSSAMLGPFATGLTRLRLRAGEPVLCGPPLFHGFGLATLALAIFLGSPLILRRRFDAESTAAAIARHRVGFLSAVPVMIQRLLDLPPEVLGRYDLSSLRIVLSAGSALSPALATRAREQWGEVLHNGYGSSEVGVASLSTPEDLRDAPGTVGRPSLGTKIRILDEHDRPVPPGDVGRIFVGGGMQFSGYTGGGGKQVVDGLMSSGDRGHFDAAGRLFVDGREDDMIVSGGENVYPQEVEDCLAARPELREVAVLGADDDAFGQRLVAFAVRRPGETVGEDELREHVRTSLARFKAPRAVLFLDELPRNGVGKVSRTALLAVVREDAARSQQSGQA